MKICRIFLNSSDLLTMGTLGGLGLPAQAARWPTQPERILVWQPTTQSPLT
jgi:hypothetical protein